MKEHRFVATLINGKTEPVRVEVDWQRIADALGKKAKNNKSKIAIEVGGAVKVTATRASAT